MPVPATVQLPLSSTVAPGTSEELAQTVQHCFASATPIYPIGGGTSQNYGLVPKQPGLGVSLSNLNRVIDYPARDMTITVEAGITMAELAHTLASERQQLPIDVPQAEQATLGGVVATNWNGPRRYGLGTVRDYVIGISAVDGRGAAFKGGGRVVKNVAGYDFCKLLTGSLGVLGVISQITLKVRPIAEKSLLAITAIGDAQQLDAMLAVLSASQTTPTSICVLSGKDWSGQAILADVQSASPQAFYVIVGLEGTALEVDWMVGELSREWREQRLPAASVVDGGKLLPQMTEWPADENCPLILKANVRPSGVVPFVQAARDVDPACSILSYAGNGVVFVKFSAFPATGLSRALIGKLQPAAASQGGHVVVLSNPSGADATLQSIFGPGDPALEVMRAVKQKFDPQGILNPGRFVI
jgi:glycolate oxidase FAD binding subunit